MTRGITRVRWNPDERLALIQRTQAILAEQPGESIRSVVTQALQSFPLERRRKVDAKTIRWIRDGVKVLPALQAPATAETEPVFTTAHVAVTAVAPPASVPPASPQPTASSPATAATAEPSATTNPLVTTISNMAVEIIVSVLGDARVRLAVRALFTNLAMVSATNTTASAATMAKAMAIANAPETQRSLVLVAGVTSSEGRGIEKTFDGMLSVKTWSLEQTRDELSAYADQARLIIGIEGQLSPAIDSSLRRLGDRYVSHRGGMQALHKRLAEEAMR